MPAPITSSATLVNTYTADDQRGTAVTALPDGGWLVLWMSWGQDGSALGVYGQRYTAAGLPAGAEFKINMTTVNSEHGAQMTVLSDGGWVVAWNSISTPFEYALYAQRYTAAGAPTGPEVRIDTAPGSQWNPSLAALPDGGWVIAWNSDDDASGAFDTYAQRFDALGAPAGAEFRVNSATASYEYEPSITALGGGGWVVSWMARDQDGSSWGVYQQRYDGAGLAVGGEVRVNVTTAGAQHLPSVAALADGGWVVAWQSLHPDGSSDGVYVRRYDAAGAAVGSEVKASVTSAGNQAAPLVVAMADGGWAVGWSSEDPSAYDPTGAQESGLYARRFSAAGWAGDEVRLGTGLGAVQIAPLPTGGLVASWNAYSPDSSSYEVYARTVALAAGSGPNVINGTEGDDEIAGTPGEDQINGLGGNDFLFGMAGNDQLNGGDGDDALRGDGGASYNGPGGSDALSGGAGDDYLNGDAGADSYDGGEGFDRVSFHALAATQGAVANLMTQIISNDGFGNAETMVSVEALGAGTAFADHFTGDDGANLLLGDKGDTLIANGGDDTFLLGSAPAFLDGGGGVDTITMFSGTMLIPDTNGDGLAELVSTTIGVDLDLRFNTIYDDGFGNSGTIVNVENVGGSEFEDAILGSDIANVLTGYGGPDLLFGYGGNDTLIGGDGDDTLRGDGPGGYNGPSGGDTLIGGAGDDYMAGGAGTDSFDGGEGFDRISFYALAATQAAIASLITQTISNDGFGNAETMVSVEGLGSGTAFADHFTGDDNANLLFGDSGDTLIANGGDDTFFLGSAPAFVDGGGGVDTITMFSRERLIPDTNGDGLAELESTTIGVDIDLRFNTIYDDGFGNSGIIINVENVGGSELDDAIVGNDNANILTGYGGADLLFGFGGSDTLDGGEGDDLLDGGDGDDTLNGGGGSDTARYAAAGGAVFVDLASATAGGAAGNDILIGIENVTGSAFNDEIVGDAGGNALAGEDGDDFLAGEGGDDNIDGGGGDDAIEGGDGDDLLIGGSGHDALRGRAGADELHGGDGDDFLNGGLGDDIIDGGDGFDRATYSSGAIAGVTVDLRIDGVAQNTGSQGMDILIGIENVSGTRFDDVLHGDEGDNWIWGGSDGSGVTGDDTLRGGGGNDLIQVGTGNHFLRGGSGTDTLSLHGNGTDITAAGVTVSLALQGAAQNSEQGMMNLKGFENLSGSLFDDVLAGNNADNLLAGDSGNDNLGGGNGDDTLYGDGRVTVDTHRVGGSGPIVTYADVADVAYPEPWPGIPGGGGNDVLDGGKGADTLVGGGGDDVLTGGQGYDTFMFGANDGDDRITDFQNKDTIRFEGISGVDDFGDLTLTRIGQNTLITWGTGDSILVEGTRPNQLHASDFVFG